MKIGFAVILIGPSMLWEVSEKRPLMGIRKTNKQTNKTNVYR